MISQYFLQSYHNVHNLLLMDCHDRSNPASPADRLARHRFKKAQSTLQQSDYLILVLISTNFQNAAQQHLRPSLTVCNARFWLHIPEMLCSICSLKIQPVTKLFSQTSQSKRQCITVVTGLVVSTMTSNLICKVGCYCSSCYSH